MDARAVLLKVLLGLLLTGCASLPRVDPQPPPWRIAEPAGYLGGNRVDLLVDGPQVYEAMFEAMAAAQRHIHLATYMICSDQVGRRLARLLLRKRREGVVVRMVYDSAGSRCAAPAYLDRLRRSGIEVVAHNPPSYDGYLYPARINHRNHRKLLIIDGRVAFTGGINFTSYYSTSSFVPLRHRDRYQGWRDTHIRVGGPIVGQFQRLFLDNWRQHRPLPELPGARFTPEQPTAGSARVRLIASSGLDGDNPIYRAYLRAIRGARQRVWITQAYFTPDRQLLQALVGAARRGVDVRLLLPGFSDLPLVAEPGRARYRRLLENGVLIYERNDALVHAKTAVIDGIWSTVGSANLDYRSFLHNDEANAMILDRGFARRMEALFRADLEQAQRIELAQWRQRPWLQRLKERISLLFEYWI